VSPDARWVVTGGAGYVGGHVVAALCSAGADVVVLDDLSTGRPDRLPAGVPLVCGRVGDRRVLDEVLRGAAGVVHLAALTSAPESLRRPLAYYQANVTDLAVLLTAMVDLGVPRLVASSSAAVYGDRTGRDALTACGEGDPLHPSTPYGTTKLVGERLIAETAAAAGLSTVALRYFNVAGASGPALFDVREAGVIPRVLAAQRDDAVLTVHGIDRPTPDGSPVRDFVHAADIASAHVSAVDRLTSGWQGSAVYNVGTGHGASVLEVIAQVEAITGAPVRWTAGPARPGDPDFSVASSALIARELGWRARHDLADCIASAWTAMPGHRSVGPIGADGAAGVASR
jgi:UDP-glucose 4-epimerase